eukprot:scaffold2100_cov207-Amphora_coffeaeformis.AAC.4
MANKTETEERLLLVDTRSRGERSVSTLQGAITMQELEKRHSNLLSKVGHDNQNDDNLHVILYCTVGFRAALEAQRLQKKYPTCRISVLDGIACYTNYYTRPSSLQSKTTTTTTTQPPPPPTPPETLLPKIVHPGHPEQHVHVVHVYTERFASCLNLTEYQPIVYSSVRANFENLRFGMHLLWSIFKDKVHHVLFSSSSFPWSSWSPSIK